MYVKQLFHALNGLLYNQIQMQHSHFTVQALSVSVPVVAAGLR